MPEPIEPKSLPNSEAENPEPANPAEPAAETEKNTEEKIRPVSPGEYFEQLLKHGQKLLSEARSEIEEEQRKDKKDRDSKKIEKLKDEISHIGKPAIKRYGKILSSIKKGKFEPAQKEIEKRKNRTERIMRVIEGQNAGKSPQEIKTLSSDYTEMLDDHGQILGALEWLKSFSAPTSPPDKRDTTTFKGVSDDALKRAREIFKATEIPQSVPETVAVKSAAEQTQEVRPEAKPAERGKPPVEDTGEQGVSKEQAEYFREILDQKEKIFLAEIGTKEEFLKDKANVQEKSKEIARKKETEIWENKLTDAERKEILDHIRESGNAGFFKQEFSMRKIHALMDAGYSLQDLKKADSVCGEKRKWPLSLDASVRGAATLAVAFPAGVLLGPLGLVFGAGLAGLNIYSFVKNQKILLKGETYSREEFEKKVSDTLKEYNEKNTAEAEQNLAQEWEKKHSEFVEKVAQEQMEKFGQPAQNPETEAKDGSVEPEESKKTIEVFGKKFETKEQMQEALGVLQERENKYRKLAEKIDSEKNPKIKAKALKAFERQRSAHKNLAKEMIELANAITGRDVYDDALQKVARDFPGIKYAEINQRIGREMYVIIKDIAEPFRKLSAKEKKELDELYPFKNY